MKWLTFELIKAQLRLDDEQARLERTLLELYGESAEATVLQLTRRTVDDLVEEYGEVPRPLIHASLLLVDLSYQHRTMVSVQSMSMVPYTFDLLVKPYMRLTTGDTGGDDILPDGTLMDADGLVLMGSDGAVLVGG